MPAVGRELSRGRLPHDLYAVREQQIASPKMNKAAEAALLRTNASLKKHHWRCANQSLKSEPTSACLTPKSTVACKNPNLLPQSYRVPS